jgi:hypothetical protein
MQITLWRLAVLEDQAHVIYFLRRAPPKRPTSLADSRCMPTRYTAYQIKVFRSDLRVS